MAVNIQWKSMRWHEHANRQKIRSSVNRICLATTALERCERNVQELTSSGYCTTVLSRDSHGVPRDRFPPLLSGHFAYTGLSDYFRVCQVCEWPNSARSNKRRNIKRSMSGWIASMAEAKIIKGSLSQLELYTASYRWRSKVLTIGGRDPPLAGPIPESGNTAGWVDVHLKVQSWQK